LQYDEENLGNHDINLFGIIFHLSFYFIPMQYKIIMIYFSIAHTRYYLYLYFQRIEKEE
jgi:hypothetical protein